ncbi:unnamed protein product [Anisakis simplex]|uniref:Kynurenine 3-monooxygenase n=1 Tax=Anisakis simplex TaxID=6269 RepID=A0A0M3K2Q3_ANISI|nr:unnamed protein product [Anisakis simplex]
MPKVVIAGAGLVGALNACYFAKRGWQVEVYEARKDIRTMEHVQGRSINLALSERGKSALSAVGLSDYIVNEGVKMDARLVHGIDGVSTDRQPYGHPGQHIVSINRRHLNEVMISQAEKYEEVNFFFEHKVLKVDLDSKQLILKRMEDGEEICVRADLICACDGAYSAIRRALSTQPCFDYSQEYIEHGYIELNILPKNDQFALEPNVFHLWPRGNFCLIALANIDKTFTVTIFAPFQIFEQHMSDDESIVDFFTKNFPDATELIGTESLLETFHRVKPLPLVSIKCKPHNFGDCVLLMGDAAHAMVPFYGQGMNAGFEDCLVLSEVLDQIGDKDIAGVLKHYSAKRVKDAHAINDLAMYNYCELRDLVNHASFKLRRKFDLFLNRIFPRIWIPLYGMVTFSRIRYHEVIERKKRQDRVGVKDFANFNFLH